MAVLELVLALPILILPILAIMRFGLMYANLQQVALACRMGAEEASQTAGLATAASIPNNILQAVDRTLATAKIQRCTIRLEHNAGGTQEVLVDSATTTCNCGSGSMLSGTLPPGEYVRLTVCVPVQELVPRCLAGFGLGVCSASDMVESTTVFRYELGP